jgi:DNA replication protein DnaC
MLSNHTLEVFPPKATPKQAEYILELFDCEIAYREQSKKRRLVRRAAFPVPKTFEGYDWSCVSLPPSITREELEDASFIERAENLICFGPVGVGKSHMVTAIGMAACQRGRRVRFYTTSELVLRLMAAREDGTLAKFLADTCANDALILDEYGYVPIDRDGARLLFQVVSRAYESKSLLLTTNLEFSRWGSMLTEESMASAMADRLLHHGHVVTFKGESYRIRHALMNTKCKGAGGDEH